MEAGGPSRRKRKLEEPPAARAERGTHDREPPPGVGNGEDGAAAAADRISDLPDPILADIVSLLPTKDGARTQILASRWRHLWSSASLKLDYDGLACLCYYLTKHDHALAAVIPRLLSAHPGPGRRFCVSAHYLRSRPAAVDAWLRSPTLDGLHELEFCHVYAYEPTGPLPLLSALPASAFRFSPTLRVATIRKCHLPDSTAQVIHFPQLKQLALVNVVVSETSLHSMIAGCPALECLLIQGSSGFRRIRINSHTLRSFGVRVGSHPAVEFELEELIIEDAPCLERLLRLDLFDGLNVSVTFAPKLQIIGCLSDRRDFSKSLKIGSHAVIQEEKKLWRRKHRDLNRCFDIPLKTIGLGSYRGIKSDVDFVTFFVLNAKVLELMIVHVSPQDYYRGFAAEESRKLKFENRASRARGAQIHFTTDRCPCGVKEINHVHDLDLTDPFVRDVHID